MARSMTHRSSTGHGSSRDDAGFTLLESVVALTMFVIVLTFGAIGISQTIRLTGVTSAKVGAANIATGEIERLRLANLTGHALVLTPPAGSIPSTFQVTDTTGTCSSGVLPLTVAVTWGSGARSVVYNSELAC